MKYWTLDILESERTKQEHLESAYLRQGESDPNPESRPWI